MKIFISWSGDKSKQVALLLQEWIKMVIQATQPWVSTNIQSGSLWFQELNEQLRDVSIGIVCLTAENKEKPWIHFESGALAKGLTTSRVCTFLIDITNEQIGQPLAQFNHTTPDKEGMFNLISTINTHIGDNTLSPAVLQKAFDKNYPDFESGYREIISKPSPINTDATKRDSTDILNEVLQTVRGLEKKMLSMDSHVGTKRVFVGKRAEHLLQLKKLLSDLELQMDFGPETDAFSLQIKIDDVKEQIYVLELDMKRNP